MGWECAECNDHEADIVAVCHHCGKPLCAKDLVVIFDDAFAARPKKPANEAAHCRRCRRQHHLGSVPLGKASR